MEEHRPKKLLDQVCDAIRLKHYSYRTEQAYDPKGFNFITVTRGCNMLSALTQIC